MEHNEEDQRENCDQLALISHLYKGTHRINRVRSRSVIVVVMTIIQNNLVEVQHYSFIALDIRMFSSIYL
jgi:hypothetical protein